MEEQQKNDDPKGMVDQLLAKLTSRKLLVWSFATAFFILKMLDADWWAYISIAYVGSEGFADIITRFKAKK